MDHHTVRFNPTGQSAPVDDGVTLLDAAAEAGIVVKGICGRGACGRCKMIVLEGRPRAKRTPLLSRADVEQGAVLACQTTVASDLLVAVPDRILARKVVGADRFVDRRFVSVELDRPWMESAGRRVRIRAEAPGATAGNAILLWHAPCAAGGLKIGGIEQAGRTLSFRSFLAPGVAG